MKNCFIRKFLTCCVQLALCNPFCVSFPALSKLGKVFAPWTQASSDVASECMVYNPSWMMTAWLAKSVWLAHQCHNHTNSHAVACPILPTFHGLSSTWLIFTFRIFILCLHDLCTHQEQHLQVSKLVAIASIMFALSFLLQPVVIALISGFASF